MYYDTNMEFMRDRTYWLGFLLLASFGVYWSYKYYYEANRW